MTRVRSLVWFRNDLRIHDHKPLYQAVLHSEEIIPFYCWEDRFLSTTSFGFQRTGKFRTDFIVQSILDLKKTLQQHYSADLWVANGSVVEALGSIHQQYPFQKLYYFEEPAPEEHELEQSVEQAMALLGVECISYWGSTLCSKEDLPFNLLHIPETFTKFRKEIEENCSFAAPLPPPLKIKVPDNWIVPETSNLPIPTDQTAVHTAYPFVGGETNALIRLQDYIWDTQSIKEYKETRNQLLGTQYSTKFSAYLSVGAISPRKIYEEIKEFEAKVVANESTYWVIFELLWRDYFKFLTVKYYSKFFKAEGIKKSVDCNWEINWEKFDRWKNGTTGNPFIDANMRELKYTGFMSNRGRQNVASFLCKDLQVHWLMGAEYFESMLLDYDVCSNYGNWAYIAGVGVDPRGYRYFNTFSQAQQYDRHALYTKTWVPELKVLEESDIHEIYRMSPETLESKGIKLGVDYPEYIVKPQKNKSLKYHV